MTDRDLVYVVGLSWAEVRRLRVVVRKEKESLAISNGQAEVFGFEHWQVRQARPREVRHEKRGSHTSLRAPKKAVDMCV